MDNLFNGTISREFFVELSSHRSKSFPKTFGLSASRELFLINE